jgi:putative methyltransferase (TIGR04325 family)
MTGALSLPEIGLLTVVLFAVVIGAQKLDKRLPLDRLAGRVKRMFRRSPEAIQGYEHPDLVEVIFQKTVAYKPTEPWPVMAGVSSVLDFGGGCGLHYKQANSKTIRWAVVETPAMVARASELSTDRLQFFSDISEAAKWLGDIEVMHSNGALQYTPNPEQTLEQLCSINAKTMLWYRTHLSDHSTEQELQSSLLGNNGPGSAPAIKEKTVQYASTRIPKQTFLDAHAGYQLAERGADWFRFVK